MHSVRLNERKMVVENVREDDDDDDDEKYNEGKDNKNRIWPSLLEGE